MDKDQTKKNTKSHPLNTSQFFRGISFSGNFIFLIYVIPWIFVQFFKIGLEGAALWTLMIVGILLLLLPFLLRLPSKTRFSFNMILQWFLGLSLPVLGLIIEFIIDENSIKTIIFLGSILLGGYYSIFSEIYTQMNEKVNIFPEIPLQKNKFSFLLGMATTIALIFGISVAIPNSIPLYSILGGIFILKPIFHGKEIKKCVNGDIKEKPKSPTNPTLVIGDRIRGFLSFLLKSTILGIIVALPMYYIAEYEISHFFWIFLGISLGVIVYGHLRKKNKNKDLNHYISLIGLNLMYGLFFLNWEYLTHPVSIIFMGFFLPFSFFNMLEEFYSSHTAQGFDQAHFVFQRQSFFLVAILIAAGLTAHEYKFLLRDREQIIWIMPVISIGLSMLFLGLKKIWFDKNTVKEQNEEMETSDTQKEANKKEDKQKKHLQEAKINIPKIISALSIIFLLVVPLMTTGLYFNSRPYVMVELDTPMYTVEGELVESIRLDERSAKILLYEPNPTGKYYGAHIRPNKTIRLGGYFYGNGSMTPEESKTFIGNNFDVYALGGYTENFYYPQDILDIKEINPEGRFYIMNFATCLGENETWSVDGDLAPYTKWNETMDTWTVKYNDGTEAIGVRRTSPDSDAHLMDLGSQEWGEYYAWIWDHRAKKYHAEGVVADEVMWYGYWGTEVEELRDYNSIDEIYQSCYDWIETVDKNMEREFLTQAFWDKAQQYQQGLWGELAFRAGGAYGNRVDDRQAVVWYEEMNWMEIVENMKKQISRNRSHIWAAWYEREDPKALEYSVATYLMGIENENRSLVFHPQPVWGGGYPHNIAGYSLSNVKQEIDNHPELFDLELGDTLGDMKKIDEKMGSYWQRDFENGIVLVNPYHAYVPGFDAKAKWNPSH